MFGEVVGGGSRIADGYVDVPPVGGGNRTTVSSGRPRVRSEEGTTGAKLGDRLPGSNLEGNVVTVGFFTEIGGAGGVGRGKDEGLLGKC